ncbi:MAG: peptidoglycan-associated lipoprotein Pal [Candidatus Schekmanbacteria bacterium]|nr:MAG: peptidoglycan-associated lipoprotein Pal [Candidatus Schekmanbacteria bacterium]
MYLKKESRLLLFFIIALSSLFLISSCAKKEVVKETPSPAPETKKEEVAPPPEEVKEEAPVEAEEEIDEEALREELIKRISSQIEDVFFAFDRYDLSEMAKKKLEKNAEVLKKNPSVNVLIEGHCDERGTVEYNLVLGEKRANAAKEYLVNLGVDSSRIDTISYGEERPFDPGHNEIAWAKNRRAHFVIK